MKMIDKRINLIVGLVVCPICLIAGVLDRSPGWVVTWVVLMFLQCYMYNLKADIEREKERKDKEK